MKPIVAFVSAVVLCLGAANACAGDLLFEKASRNYNRNGVVGQAYRREFEKRMFSHSAWRQRLYYEAPGAEANETLEIYVRADGSSWLSVRTARPALSPLIRWRPLDSQRTELAKELDRIRIQGCEVELPSQLAAKLEHLWKIMLPGVDSAPIPTVFPVHSPTFIAFAQENNSVKTGTVAIAAYGTEAHKLFVSIVGDLKKMCDGGPVGRSLPRKVEQLTARLVH